MTDSNDRTRQYSENVKPLPHTRSSPPPVCVKQAHVHPTAAFVLAAAEQLLNRYCHCMHLSRKLGLIRAAETGPTNFVLFLVYRKQPPPLEATIHLLSPSFLISTS